MVSNYASGRKHAKHRYILAVNLPDTFRCPKRQIATKKYKIICLSSMCYLKQRKQQNKVQFAHCLVKICRRLRAAVYKYREFAVKTEISKYFIFSQEKPFCKYRKFAVKTEISKYFIFSHEKPFCKYREFAVKTEISKYFIFSQKEPFDETFLKITIKVSKEFPFSRKPPKSEMLPHVI